MDDECYGHGIEAAELVLPCADLEPTLAFFTGRLGFRVERGVHAVADQDREADLAERLPELAGEAAPVAGVPFQEACEVERANAVVLVEVLDVARLGEVVGLRLLHLLVADVVAVRRLDAALLALAHGLSL